MAVILSGALTDRMDTQFVVLTTIHTYRLNVHTYTYTIYAKIQKKSIIKQNI